MFNSFNTAVAALNAAGTAVDIIGNNLANLNTPGFKRSTVDFHDLIAEAFHEPAQGAIQQTGGKMDAAISGQGYFVVRDTAGQMLYTRAGDFRMDASGNLQTATGETVQGWVSTIGNVNTNTAAADIKLPTSGLLPAVATTDMSVDVNLNASAVIGSTDATYTAPIKVVDSLGTSHTLNITFTKSAANTWDYVVTIPGDEVTSGTAGQTFPIPNATGSLVFDPATGKLQTPAASGGPVAIAIAGLSDGAADLAVNWDLYNSDGTTHFTQFAQTSSLAGSSQNGVAAGQITGYSLQDGGKIVADYSNGKQLVVAQLALAAIRNPDSLEDAGGNNLKLTAESAAPVVGPAETGGRGKIVGASLEGSTSDIAKEFTSLMVFQRSYQANARVITTADEISQEAINLKRQ